MGKRLHYTLSDEELEVLEEAINHAPEPEVRQRAIAIRLLHLGQSPEQAAQIERFWLYFKQLAVANHLHRSLDDLQRSIDEVLRNQNTLTHPNRLKLLDYFRSVA
jgi:hypothetical protein